MHRRGRTSDVQRSALDIHQDERRRLQARLRRHGRSRCGLRAEGRHPLASEITAHVLDAEPFKNFPAIAIRKTCDGGDLLCKSTFGSDAELTLDPGVYAIIVDSDRTVPGEVSVRAELTPLLDCSTAIPLAFTGGTASASGDTSTAKHLAVGCDGSAAPDRMYAFELVKPQQVTATVTSKTAGYTCVARATTQKVEWSSPARRTS